MSKNLSIPAALAATLAFGNGEAQAETPTPTAADIVAVCDATKVNMVTLTSIAAEFPDAMGLNGVTEEELDPMVQEGNDEARKALMKEGIDKLVKANQLLETETGSITLAELQNLMREIDTLLYKMDNDTEAVNPVDRFSIWNRLRAEKRNEWMTTGLQKEGVACPDPVVDHAVLFGQLPNPTEVSSFEEQTNRAFSGAYPGALGSPSSETETTPTTNDNPAEIIEALETLMTKKTALEAAMRELKGLESQPL